MITGQEAQDVVVQQERYDKLVQKQLKKRRDHRKDSGDEEEDKNIRSEEEKLGQDDEGTHASQVHDSQTSTDRRKNELVGKKRSFRTKDMRLIDEETLKIVDVEFLIKQETHMSDYLKEPIMGTQFIRTTELAKVLQLKKFVLSKLRPDNMHSSLHDINLFIYNEKGANKLRNDDRIKDIVDQGYWNFKKAKISQKSQLYIREDSQTMETIWVAFTKR